MYKKLKNKEYLVDLCGVVFLLLFTVQALLLDNRLSETYLIMVAVLAATVLRKSNWKLRVIALNVPGAITIFLHGQNIYYILIASLATLFSLVATALLER